MVFLKRNTQSISRQNLAENDALFKSTYNVVMGPEFFVEGTKQDNLTRNFLILSESKFGKRTKKVSFGLVEERQYGICLGNSPSCKHGPPISLSWARTKGLSFSIDEYETMRRRRSRSQLIISAQHREELLLSMGYTITQLLAVVTDIKTKRFEDKKSLDKLIALRYWWPNHETYWHI